jgi:hypothetical protein
VGTPADTPPNSLEIKLQDESMSSLQSHSLGVSRELSQHLLATPTFAESLSFFAFAVPREGVLFPLWGCLITFALFSHVLFRERAKSHEGTRWIYGGDTFSLFCLFRTAAAPRSKLEEGANDSKACGGCRTI